MVGDSGAREMSTAETTPQQWVIVDVQVPGDYRVVIGSQLLTGRSLSRVRPPTGRLLPSAIDKVVGTGQPVGFTSAPIRAVSYRVEAAPVLGPLGEVYAVTCALAPTGKPLPAPPPRGAWEWDIATRMGRGTQELFDTTRTPIEQRKAQFSMVEYAGQLPVSSRFDAADMWSRVTNATGDELVHATLMGEGGQPLLVCGRPEFDGDNPVMFRGVTVDLTSVSSAAPEPADDLLLAVLGHSERPLAVMDVEKLHVMHWLTPPADAVQWPSDPYLRELVHPGDLGKLESHTWRNGQPVVARLPSARGGWVAVELDARRYTPEDTADARVVVSLRVIGD